MDVKLRESIMLHKMEQCAESIKKELFAIEKYESVEKDILIVVRDQPEYIESCIKSIEQNTDNYNIYVWDNGSSEPTKSYLEDSSHTIRRSEDNLGFIRPNNQLASMGNSPYIILLNSDTVVKSGWDKAMIGWLQQNPDVAEVGYLGGILDKECKGGKFDFGSGVDYICGWGLCVSRKTYDEFGLFDEEHLDFAYAEDADLSLRLREAGREIYALHLDYVIHFENKTAKTVSQERDMKITFERNHEYMRLRWSEFLIH